MKVRRLVLLLGHYLYVGAFSVWSQRQHQPSQAHGHCRMRTIFAHPTTEQGYPVPKDTTTDVDKKGKNSRQGKILGVSSARAAAALSIIEDPTRNTLSSVIPLHKLENSKSFRSLVQQRDRSFARLLVTTTERRWGQIDKVLDVCSNQNGRSQVPRRSDMLVKACLRIGATQLLFLGIPGYAAVKETVDVLKSAPGYYVPDYKVKYVNAILRRLLRDGKALLEMHTSVEDNVSPWLLPALRKDWGENSTRSILNSFMIEPPVYLSANYPANSSTAEREAILFEIARAFGGETRLMHPASIRIAREYKGNLQDWPLYDEGRWWVQDISASLPALGLYKQFSSEANCTLTNANIVDMCAAPGGKTLQLLSLGFEKVTSIEKSPRRSRRLTENLARLGMEARCSVIIEDGTQWMPPEGSPIHGILLDVPCTATGTAAKRPDILRRSEDLSDVLSMQSRLAQHCVDNILSSGGYLIYATCSILKRESEDQVRHLLEREGGAELENIPFQHNELPGFAEAIDSNGWIRVLPGMDPNCPCDGFFVARLRKK